MFGPLFAFEETISSFTGAPYVVATDGCTHAIELCMRYDQVKACKFSAYTYLSIPHVMRQLNIDYDLVEEKWAGEYQFYGTRIWDSARKFDYNMYRPNTMQCLSFGYGKPMHIGKLGAILLDDVEAYDTMSRWRADGRDLNISPWQHQTNFGVGYHYCPTLEDCSAGISKMADRGSWTLPSAPYVHRYPDLRELNFQ